jgi:4-hydroxy-3-methylbut-2-enyl diphosphate reductase IspH
MCHDIEKNKVIILLETNDKCKNNQNPMPQKARVVNQTTKKRPSTLEIISKMI